MPLSMLETNIGEGSWTVGVEHPPSNRKPNARKFRFIWTYGKPQVTAKKPASNHSANPDREEKLFAAWAQGTIPVMNDAPNQAVLLSEVKEGIATLTLNRPDQRNALNMRLMEDLLSALNEIGTDPDVRVLVLKAEGPAFCAGHDLKEMRADPREEAQARTFATCAAMMMAITQLPQPVIAQVHGIATAAGCQLVATCDLAIASEDARFATPGVHIGLFCSTPMVALSRNIGRKQAMEMLLTGDMIDAKRAETLGLINRAVPPDLLDGTVRELAEKIIAKSPLAIRTGKSAFYRQLESGLEEAYEYTGAVMVRNMMAEDAAEGIDAFLEKRKAAWKGR
jgi:enoyl-CoA hydratase/carnithine racemase